MAVIRFSAIVFLFIVVMSYYRRITIGTTVIVIAVVVVLVAVVTFRETLTIHLGSVMTEPVGH